jgi:hypothetical protein
MKMGKYDKYICTKLYKRDMLPGPSPAERDQIAANGQRIRMEHVLWIDEDVIPGAYYGESTWIWPDTYPNQMTMAEMSKFRGNDKPMFPHVHDFPELLSWWGTNPDHPEDTGSMGIIMGDEEIPLPNSWVAYIPAGMLHMPTRGPGGKMTTRPVCHWTSGPGFYTREGEEESGDKEHATAPKELKKTGELKNARYMVTGYKKDAKRPAYMRQMDPKYARPIAYIDNEVVPDAEFGCDTMWLLPGERSKAGQVIMDVHTVPHGTSIVLNAMNYADITDLCAEVELWIGGEKHIINKSFGAYIPPNVKQGPMIIRNINQQIFFMMSYPIGEGIKKYPGK